MRGGGVFNPGTLSLTGWWRASFTASPWVVTSPGIENLSEATNPPAAGSTVNGLSPADFDGTNDLLHSTSNITSFLANTGGGIAVLFNADTLSAAATEAYDDRTLLTDTAGARVSLGISTSGLRFTAYNSAAWVKTTVANATYAGTGNWAWAFAGWDGTNIWCSINGGSNDTVAIGAGKSVTLTTLTMRTGLSYDGAHKYDGKILEIMTQQTAFTAGNISNIISYGNNRYGLSL
jgi:hypothetical protein